MDQENPPAPAGTQFKPFKAGQIWQVDDFTLQISLVGKTLVHYKRYKGQSKGKPTSLSSKPDFKRYLQSRKATLIKE